MEAALWLSPPLNIRNSHVSNKTVTGWLFEYAKLQRSGWRNLDHDQGAE